MARRRISLALFLLVIALTASFTQQAPQTLAASNFYFNPYFNPYYYPFAFNNNYLYYNNPLSPAAVAAINSNPRLFFGVAGSLLAGQPLITRFTSTTLTQTSTSTATCTKVIQQACADGAFPFTTFTGRDLLDNDSLQPSPVIETEVSELADIAIRAALPDADNEQQPLHVLVGHGGPFLLNPSFHQAGQQYYFSDNNNNNGRAVVMPRQLLGGVTTVTFTVTTVTWSTSTRSITPACSRAGYFSACS